MKKILLSSIVAVSLLFNGCGEDTPEAQEYDIELALNSGNYDKAIKLLDNCSNVAGESLINCYLNMGAAYFGKAKFDIFSIAKDMAVIDEKKYPSKTSAQVDDAKEKEMNNLIFSKLDDLDLKTGIDWYKKTLSNESTDICNEKDYKTLTKQQKQSCISINPLLLKDLLDDEDNKDNNDSNVSVSLEQIIDFKNIMQDAVPEIKATDLSTIISGGTLAKEVDANQNDKLDSIEATQYALDVFAFSKTWEGNVSVSEDYNKSISYTNDLLKDRNITMIKIKITGSDNNNSFYRLVEYTDEYNTTLKTIPDVSCNKDNTKNAQNKTINGDAILPCIDLKDGNVTTLNDTAIELFNDEALITSIALASNSEDDAKSDDNKVIDFKKELCGINKNNSDISDTNSGNCDYNATSGKLIMTQKALLEYMNRDED
jgi:hypothetical protein